MLIWCGQAISGYDVRVVKTLGFGECRRFVGVVFELCTTSTLLLLLLGLTVLQIGQQLDDLRIVDRT